MSAAVTHSDCLLTLCGGEGGAHESGAEAPLVEGCKRERWSLHNLSRIDPSKEKLRHHRLLPKPFRRQTHTNLSGATLVGTDLSNADLIGADMRGANLSKANLRGAIIPRERLAACESFEGATMPDGPKRSRPG